MQIQKQGLGKIEIETFKGSIVRNSSSCLIRFCYFGDQYLDRPLFYYAGMGANQIRGKYAHPLGDEAYDVLEKC